MIENRKLKVTVHPRGAELQSIFYKDNRLEYLWNGNPAFWSKHSPILFPIVGALKEGIYHYRGKTYPLGRHGFARDAEFKMEMQGPESITFLLRSNAGTREKFPFDFELRINYQLREQALTTSYTVKNLSREEMYFSIGGHPAFVLPLQPGTEYGDYWLEFDKNETLPRWPISAEGLIEDSPVPLLNDSRRLPLSKELFARDALVLKHPASASIALKSDKTEHGLRMDFPGFPFLGIWAAKDADFVCVEPWCGIADSVDSDQELTGKEGINRLQPAGQFERAWTLTIY